MAKKSKDLKPWMFGNTTVRSAMRLPSGLRALADAGYLGRMHTALEDEMAEAMHAAGAIVSTMSGKESGVSRKWRNALVKMGFIYPSVLDRPFQEVDISAIGLPFALTPNGSRLLAAQSVRAQQEVNLRALAAVQLPSPIENEYKFPPFSPLRHVIRILLSLESVGESPHISRTEMASIVQFTNSANSLDEIVTRILGQRSQRELARSKRRFDAQVRDQIREETGYAPGTPFDYQDLNFRYLRSTGLFQSKGRGIALVRENVRVARLLAEQLDEVLSPTEYVSHLANGAFLPTDETSGAEQALQDLVDSADERQISFDLHRYELESAQGIGIARHDLQELIDRSKELEFAKEQPLQVEEILAYLEVIDTQKQQTVGGVQIAVPKDERPAYFEWALWRSFLAMNNLEIAPYEVRRFRIDQDFLPVGHAPGGASDLIAVYEDTVIVIEVTLTSNSRQEAAEGEPVRRHVADELVRFASLGKSVYGLFIAPTIDSNAAETFRIGVWYLQGDERITLDIAPMTLEQFRLILKRAYEDGDVHPNRILDVIRSINHERVVSSGAPEWKERISKLFLPTA